jgi:hypothetical protein
VVPATFCNFLKNIIKLNGYISSTILLYFGIPNAFPKSEPKRKGE